MNRKFLVVAMVLLVVIVAAVLVYGMINPGGEEFHGSLISPPKPAADFALIDQSGETTSLSDFRGKYALIFFGFTNCPDECPLTMGYLKQMYDKLGDQAENVQVILITSDPDTDTPEVMGEFLSHFDPSFIGLTASKEELQDVWADYGVTVMDDGETHSNFLYLIDTQGNLMATYPLLENSDDITADIENLLASME